MPKKSKIFLKNRIDSATETYIVVEHTQIESRNPEKYFLIIHFEYLVQINF